MAAITKDVIYGRNNHGGRAVTVSGIQLDDKQLIVQGRMLTTARLKDEWYQDVGDPERIVQGLKKCTPTPDIFTFWQRLPDIVPAYSYYSETEALSAIPLKD